MICILYNKNANNGRGNRRAYKLYKKLSKKEETLIKELDINTLNDDLNKLGENDKLVISGGDGTLHHFINNIDTNNINTKVYLLKDGSGNDYAKEHKGKLFEITDELKNLPTFKMNEKTIRFINGVGVGVDALVCKRINENIHKSTYFKVAKAAFKDFKPFSIDLEIDGIKHHYDKVLFCTCQHGKYFGGGMKIAPFAKRNDDYLDLYIVYNIGLTKLLMLFPLIYLGLHTLVKKNVVYYRCKKVKLESKTPDLFLQAEGEVREFSGCIDIER